jgi:hypothetical protein
MCRVLLMMLLVVGKPHFGLNEMDPTKSKEVVDLTQFIGECGSDTSWERSEHGFSEIGRWIEHEWKYHPIMM